MAVDVLSANDLSALMMDAKEKMKDIVIVDVRDHDYKGGNIKGSINVPSMTFGALIGQLTKEYNVSFVSKPPCGIKKALCNQRWSMPILLQR